MPDLIGNVIMDRQILFGILMGASQPVLVIDENLMISSITQKAEKVLGYKEAEHTKGTSPEGCAASTLRVHDQRP